MIDLKRPLEGAPGLLLLAAIVLFGMMIGVTVALALSWVDMKDSIANFLGGVVGAGLGSALAVLGAVHVQRRERRDRLTAPVNLLSAQLGKLHDHLIYLGMVLGKPSIGSVDQAIEKLSTVLNSVPFSAELPPSLHDRLNEIREELDFSIRRWYRYIRTWKSGVHNEADRTEAMDSVREYIGLVEALSDEVKRLV